jgi:cation diffusion facilitator CzcD-associated flavoprotein CzcO
MTVEPASLAELEARLAYDLACLNHPPANWVIPTQGPAGEKVSDVVIIGAGMAGLVACHALIARGIRNLRIVDRAPAGREGPWVTYARMETLRSPKELTGPAAGLPSVTFRAWYTAQFGVAAWNELYRIPRPMWMDYLRWYRRVLALPVENDVEVTDIAAHHGLLRLTLARGAPVLARKVVLATGRDGLGRPAIPAFARHLPATHCAHTADDIDFAALRGRRVAVIGIGASAVDNAAEALEAGASEVRLLIRRTTMPRVNKFKGIGSAGFTSGFPVLADAWRWKFMHYAGVVATPSPRNSTLRVSRHRNAFFHFGCAVRSVELADNHLVIGTTRRTFEADFMILGTGFTVEPDIIPEIARFAPHIARWSDRYAPPPELADAELAEFPYLASDFSFLPRADAVPGLSDLHCFNHAASLSLGKIAGDIPKISEGAILLAEAIAANLFCRDAGAYFQQAVDYDVPELLGDEWTDAEQAPADATQTDMAQDGAMLDTAILQET